VIMCVLTITLRNKQLSSEVKGRLTLENEAHT